MIFSAPSSKAIENQGPESDPVLIENALEIFAIYYQSCMAINAPIIDIEDYNKFETVVQRKKYGSYYKRYLEKSRLENYHRNNPVFIHFTENDLTSDNVNLDSICLNSFKQPPVYAFGGSARYANNTLDFLKDLTRDSRCKDVPGNGVICRSSTSSRTALSGLDCSAYVSAVLGISGIRFHSKQTSSYLRYSTSRIHEVVKNKSTSCFQAPMLETNSPLKSGDILNIGSSHVVIIDEIGDDPLGIKSKSNIDECDDITVDEFTFSVIQSSSTNNMGLQRSYARAYFPKAGSTFRTNLELIAKKVCEAYFNGEKFWQMTNSSSNRFSLTRFDRNKKGCYGIKANIKQRECFDVCN